MAANDLLKYLGHKYDVLGQIKPCINDYTTGLRRIGEDPLRPPQKLHILKQYLIPRFINYLQNLNLTKKLLKSLDRLNRVQIRKWLHWRFSSSPDAFLHAPIKFGGLGVISYFLLIPANLLRRLNKLSLNNNAVVRDTMNLPAVTKLRMNVSALNGHRGGNRLLLNKEWAQKLETGFSGNGLIQCSQDTSSNN